MNQFKTKYEDEARKLTETDRKLNSTEIQKKAIEKQFEI